MYAALLLGQVLLAVAGLHTSEFTIATDGANDADAVVLKTDGTGTCSQSALYKWKYQVDRDGDGATNDIVLVWCDNTVSVMPIVVAGGAFPIAADTWRDTTRSAGRTPSNKSYLDCSIASITSGQSIGTIVKDTFTTKAIATWYTQHVHREGPPAGFDPYNQEPSISFLDGHILTFVAHAAGRHSIVLDLIDAAGSDSGTITLYVDADGYAEITVPVNVTPHMRVRQIHIHRPGDWHDTMGVPN